LGIFNESWLRTFSGHALAPDDGDRKGAAEPPAKAARRLPAAAGAAIKDSAPSWVVAYPSARTVRASLLGPAVCRQSTADRPADPQR